jgi:dUTP pyrophosphatase
MFEYQTSVLQYTGVEPTRAHHDDAGLDLYVQGDYWIEPGHTVDLDLGVSIKSPPGTWTLLTGRSSTMRNRGLLVAQGIIDPGYVGPLYATVHNLRKEIVEVHDGERIAQLIVLPNLTQFVEPVRVTELPDTARGDKGFGSSGR